MDATDKFDSLSDEELVKLAQEDDTDAINLIYERYKSMVRSKARGYFLVGADKEDILQEGMIGLHKAIKDFRAEKQVKFHSFADICIQRQMITAIKSATRLKHIPLNSYISLNHPVSADEMDRTLLDMLPTVGSRDPAEIIIGRESLDFVQRSITALLTPLEKETLELFLDGMSYQEIAARLGRGVKSIDNALQRIKKKTEKCLREGAQ